MASNSQSRIKDEELYEELREEGNSKQKSARIANAAARDGRSRTSQGGWHRRPIENAQSGSDQGTAQLLNHPPVERQGHGRTRRR